eukprot:5595502-Pleurochrysis_carterae.AAC.1
MVSAVARLSSFLPAAGSAVPHRGASCSAPRLPCPPSPLPLSCASPPSSTPADVHTARASHTSLPHNGAGSRRPLAGA